MTKELTYNEVENKVQSITNTYYSFSAIEMDLINSSDDIGYNDRVIYYSDGWQEYGIRFKYYLSSDYDVIVYSIKKRIVINIG